MKNRLASAPHLELGFFSILSVPQWKTIHFLKKWSLTNHVGRQTNICNARRKTSVDKLSTISKWITPTAAQVKIVPHAFVDFLWSYFKRQGPNKSTFVTKKGWWNGIIHPGGRLAIKVAHFRTIALIGNVPSANNPKHASILTRRSFWSYMPHCCMSFGHNERWDVVEGWKYYRVHLLICKCRSSQSVTYPCNVFGKGWQISIFTLLVFQTRLRYFHPILYSLGYLTWLQGITDTVFPWSTSITNKAYAISIPPILTNLKSPNTWWSIQHWSTNKSFWLYSASNLVIVPL